ncbi:MULTISPECIES: histone deacetylase [unclassified Nitratiruptor]|uniref:histone deacetylase family protein n=1 Tax=unclassified Nitratiruptor TaxID=2624044 RepID=UPI001915955E|nr:MULTISPECIES: histone deacetylase [unclassified Nitratiruptor]BCD60539.1 acetoin utilization protein [Nitratiruptor sp. YY08-10]BCD63972.1 acetoin utilization protein [Nitratiruptor sp. YY08-14]
MVGYVYDPIFTEHGSDEHIERPARVEVIDEVARNFPLKRFPIKKASKEDLKKIHEAHYVEWVERAYEEGYRFILNEDTLLTPKSFEVASYAAGSTMPIIDAFTSDEIKRAFLNIRPPGHHAERRTGQGFCIFNNVALMARYAQSKGFRKVMIIDFDVHHGNGTQDIFYSDDTVCYFSTHEHNNYPYFTGSVEEKGEGKGEGFNINRPYGDYCKDEELLKLYEDLPKWFDFDIVLVSAGYDLMRDEAISTAQITFEGLRALVQKILQFAGDKPVAFLLEGGYNLDSLATSVAVTLEELTKDEL